MDTTRSRPIVIALFATAYLATACASGPPPGPSPESIAGANAKTILVSPFNIVSGLPPELEGSTQMVSDALVAHLEAHGKKVSVIRVSAGTQLWKASIKEVRKSGQKQKFENAAKVYARKIREQIDFDVLIVPSLFVQNAKVRNRVARWDGAEQKMTFKKNKDARQNGFVGYQLGTVNIKAASIFAHILDRDGNLIQSKRSGIEVIQHLTMDIQLKGGPTEATGRVERSWDIGSDIPAIEEPERVANGVAAVLSPFLPEDPPTNEEMPEAPSENESPAADAS